MFNMKFNGENRLIVIIDGYNLLKQLFPGQKESLGMQRKQLVKQLGYYKKKKGKEIKEIILVFDGGFFRHATREVHSGIAVIFSGQKNSADEWIFNYVKKHKEKEILLVTMDKELIGNCQQYGVDAISVFDFYKIMQNGLLKEAEKDFEARKVADAVQKYETDFEMSGNNEKMPQIDNKALDMLMEQSTINIGHEKKDDIYSDKKARKSRSQKPSKKEKKIYKKIKKL